MSENVEAIPVLSLADVLRRCVGVRPDAVVDRLVQAGADFAVRVENRLVSWGIDDHGKTTGRPSAGDGCAVGDHPATHFDGFARVSAAVARTLACVEEHTGVVQVDEFEEAWCVADHEMPRAARWSPPLRRSLTSRLANVVQVFEDVGAPNGRRKAAAQDAVERGEISVSVSDVLVRRQVAERVVNDLVGEPFEHPDARQDDRRDARRLRALLNVSGKDYAPELGAAIEIWEQYVVPTCERRSGERVTIGEIDAELTRRCTSSNDQRSPVISSLVYSPTVAKAVARVALPLAFKPPAQQQGALDVTARTRSRKTPRK